MEGEKRESEREGERILRRGREMERNLRERGEEGVRWREKRKRARERERILRDWGIKEGERWREI